jgi:hypothetical protein
MADQVQGSEPSVTSLVTGIINDGQELIKQQIALVRTEIHDDLHKTKEAALSLVIGLGTALLGIVLLCWGIVYLLSWATNWPAWAWFLIVGGVIAITGGALIYAGKKRFESFNPLPDQSAEALRENVQWITNRR